MAVKSFTEYQALAVRTMKVESHERMVLHCVMGICGEAGELMDVESDNMDKIIGEMGDCMWYPTNLLHLYGVALEGVVQKIHRSSMDVRFKDPMKSLVVTGCQMLDYMKKVEFYEKPIDQDILLPMVRKYISALLECIDRVGVNPLSVCEGNVKKLEKRYPDLRFNADHASNRDTVAEDKAGLV